MPKDSIKQIERIVRKIAGQLKERYPEKWPGVGRMNPNRHHELKQLIAVTRAGRRVMEATSEQAPLRKIPSTGNAVVQVRTTAAVGGILFALGVALWCAVALGLGYSSVGPQQWTPLVVLVVFVGVAWADGAKHGRPLRAIVEAALLALMLPVVIWAVNWSLEAAEGGWLSRAVVAGGAVGMAFGAIERLFRILFGGWK